MRCENCDVEMESLGYGDMQCPECKRTVYSESEEDFIARIYGVSDVVLDTASEEK